MLAYIKFPFLGSSGDFHQNAKQSLVIAQIAGELGYNVDVIDYNQAKAKFKKKYDAIFSIHVLDDSVWWGHLKPEAKKIVYFTGSEPNFANSAENQRVKNLEERRGVKLIPRRNCKPSSKSIEQFDAAIIIGNEYNLRTWTNSFDLKKTFLVPNTGYDFGNRFDSAHRNPRSFLFFGSAGCVHKGLDLLLEIFAEENFPCELFVCGLFEKEEDFVNEYRKELYQTKNIHPVGYIDIWGEEFEKKCGECTYTILPSCSEGMAGTITTCMSAGLIPICSRECGYEDDEVINLPDCSKETIRKTILDVSQRDDSWIAEKSRRALELSRTKYCMESFRKSMYEALSSVL